MNRIYLDNAATTKISPHVLNSMLPWLGHQFGNPSSLYEEGRAARLAVESSRKTVAHYLGVKPAEIIFTSCGTESNNMALRSAIRSLRITHVITARTEHPAVLNTVRDMAQRGEVVLSYVALLPDGSADLHDLHRLLMDKQGKCLVTLMHANNETGMMLDLKMTGQVCEEHGAYFHSDCVQTIGHLPLDLSKLPVDMASASAHKFHGPKGSGILYVREKVGLRPFITGGGQERGMRAGTENVANIVGFASALEEAMENLATDAHHIMRLKQALKFTLSDLGCSFNGSTGEDSLFTVINAAFPRTEQTQNLLFDLDQAGISVSGGSACSAGKGSHVMEAIGATDTVNIRFSFSRYTTLNDIEQVAAALQRLITVAPAFQAAD